MFQKVLAVADLGNQENSIKALNAGLYQLADQGEIELVAVVNAGSANFFPHIPARSPTETERAAREQLERLKEKHVGTSLPCHVRIIRGREGRALVDAAKQAHADLLVMTSNKPASQLGLVNDPIAHVSTHAPCAVLIIRSH